MNKRTHDLLILLIVLMTFFLTTPVQADQDDKLAVRSQESHQGHKYSIPLSLNDEERKWFIRFQEGNMLFDGWQDITKGILAKTPGPEQSAQAQLLQELGYKIGLEWCKDNEQRKVDTSMLKEWGKQLKSTAKTNPEKLNVLLTAINSEVEALLN
ncbi:MAG: hypothetical protein CSA33_06150 [Desulfobulbus propionicus]|nr:MAG: hypothetical protein CSA33_06150 [Desulfobulbus propionicus]